MDKTINQKDLAGGLSDEDMGDILARLHKLDFAGMNTRDMNLHAQVMLALLKKIAHRHDALVKLRDEVETRTRDVALAANALDLARTLSQLHTEMQPARKRRRWRWFSLGILPDVR